MTDSDTARVQLEITIDQAKALSDAADLLTRMSLGQIEEIADLVRMGIIKTRCDESFAGADIDACRRIETMLFEVKRILGHQQNGSFGIGNPAVHISARRAYETKKAIDKAVHDYTNPGNRTSVHADGVTVRYTTDPEPIARIVNAGAANSQP